MVPAPAFSWTGVYVGAFVGYHWGDLESTGCTGICPISPSMKGGFAGVQFGGDYQFANNVVIGGFAMIPLWRPDTDITLPLVGVNFATDTKAVLVVAGRVGYAFNTVLPYAFGGYAYAKVEATSSINGVSVENGHNGFVAGAGLEWAFARNWSLDGRYTYMDFSKEPYFFGPPTQVVNWQAESHNVSLAVNYRFNL